MKWLGAAEWLVKGCGMGGGWAGGLGDGFSLLAVLPEFAAHERVLGRTGGRESRTYA